MSYILRLHRRKKPASAAPRLDYLPLQLQLAAQRFADALENSEYLSLHLQDEVQKHVAENVLRRFLPPVAGKRTPDKKIRADCASWDLNSFRVEMTEAGDGLPVLFGAPEAMETPQQATAAS